MTNTDFWTVPTPDGGYLLFHRSLGVRVDRWGRRAWYESEEEAWQSARFSQPSDFRTVVLPAGDDQ